MIQDGKKVSLEYTVYLEDGAQIDSNVGETPLTFTVGENQLFPALEQAIVQLQIGDKKEIFLQAEEAYGPVIPEAFREIEIEAIPVTFRYQGAVLAVQDPGGGVYPIRVHEIKDSKAVLDFNHPLAGKALRFELTVVAVN